MDPRDERTPFVFEGRLLLGGIQKRTGVQILSESRKCVPKEQTRKKLNYNVVSPDYYVSKNNPEYVCVCIQRIFLLLPAGLSVFMKFRAESLSPVYVMAETTITEKGGSITFRTTAY